MGMHRIDHWKELDRIQAEIAALVEAVLSSHGVGEERFDFVPPVNIVEGQGEFVVYAVIPGALEEDIDVSVEEGHLVIRGEAWPVGPADSGSVLSHREWRCGVFNRKILLPSGADLSSVSAEYYNGVLEVRIAVSGV